MKAKSGLPEDTTAQTRHGKLIHPDLKTGRPPCRGLVGSSRLTIGFSVDSQQSLKSLVSHHIL